MDLPAALTRRRSWTFHLTPWAPGCDGRTAAEPRRNRMMAAATPERAVRSLLSKLLVGPGEVRAAVDPVGDVEIIRVSDQAPLCLVWTGADAAEINTVLRWLAQTGAPERIAA